MIRGMSPIDFLINSSLLGNLFARTIQAFERLLHVGGLVAEVDIARTVQAYTIGVCSSKEFRHQFPCASGWAVIVAHGQKPFIRSGSLCFSNNLFAPLHIISPTRHRCSITPWFL